MEPNIKEVAGRIRALREDLDLTMQEMADATGRSVAEYTAQESGEQDLSFTFLFKCAQRLGVDVIELLTGETPTSRATRSHAPPTASLSSVARVLNTCTRHRTSRTSLPSRFWSRRPTLRKSRTCPFTCRITRGRNSTSSSLAKCASPTRIMWKNSKLAIC